MGQSQGYDRERTLNKDQLSFLSSIIPQAQQNSQQAAQGYAQFLPGGGGGQAIKDQAMNDYKQQTIPSILAAFGQGSKGSTGLNQALASSGSDLNTNLGSILSQLQLSAANGLGTLGQGQQNTALGTQPFALKQRPEPWWRQAILAGLSGGSNFASGLASGGYFNG